MLISFCTVFIIHSNGFDVIVTAHWLYEAPSWIYSDLKGVLKTPLQFGQEIKSGNWKKAGVLNLSSATSKVLPLAPTWGWQLPKSQTEPWVWDCIIVR